MTSGGQAGTSGERAIQLGPWGVVALVGVPVAVVTATSDIMEMRRAGMHTPWVEPALWELTSLLAIVALAPFIGWAMRRWPPQPERLAQFALIQLAMTIPFSLAHVLAIWVTREAAYWAAGARYGFFDDGVGLTLLYEWRKDVLTYAVIAAVYWGFQRQERTRAPPPAASQQRIEIREGASAVFLAPGDVLTVEAAGNYVEFHTSTRPHLVRGTLAAWEGTLAGLDFARVHRSRLVNRARIAVIKPTASGDLEITLDNGRVIAGSRRYREALEAPQ